MAHPTVLITGASRGLGAAAARTTAQMKANVVLMARSVGALESVAQEIRAAGGQALVVVGDVREAGDCQQAVSTAVDRFGRLDALVNNAGIVDPISPIAEGDPRAWERNWATNVLGSVMMTQAALPYLRQEKGRVINVSSGAAVSAISGGAAYCVAKAAIEHFTRLLAEEEPSVTSISFRPGAVDTSLQKQIRREGAQGMPAEVYARFIRYHEEGELLPAVVPACSLTALALHAPADWSGTSLAWNEEKVLSLVRQFATVPCVQVVGGSHA
jgi:NAD(P)-dependent dehydrogenase (short-subunit alcohol dehydrogenase family)